MLRTTSSQLKKFHPGLPDGLHVLADDHVGYKQLRDCRPLSSYGYPPDFVFRQGQARIEVPKGSRIVKFFDNTFRTDALKVADIVHIDARGGLTQCTSGISPVWSKCLITYMVGHAYAEPGLDTRRDCPGGGAYTFMMTGPSAAARRSSCRSYRACHTAYRLRTRARIWMPILF